MFEKHLWKSGISSKDAGRFLTSLHKISLFHWCFSNILLVKTNYLVYISETLVENGLKRHHLHSNHSKGPSIKDVRKTFRKTNISCRFRQWVLKIFLVSWKTSLQEKSVRIQGFFCPYSLQMWENMDQKNSEYGHFSKMKD